MSYKEVSFGLDDFNNAKMLSIKDSVAQLLMNLFFMRPGSLPSMPNVGINIQSYLSYKHQEDIDIGELKGKIYEQCSSVLKFLVLSDIEIFVKESSNGTMILILLPLIVDEEVMNCYIGFLKNGLDNTIQYQFQAEAA